MARNALKDNYEIRPGTLIEDFETIGEWTKTAGESIEADTVNVKTGSAALKLTSVNNVSTYAKKVGLSLDLSSVNRFAMWVYIDDVTKYSQVVTGLLYLYNGGVNYYYSAIKVDRMQSGWNKVEFKKSDFIAGGSPSWASTFTEIRIRCLSASGQTANLTVDSLVIDRYTKPKVIVTFDDGNATDYTEAFSYMETKGLKGVCFVPGENVGLAGQITLSQMQEMYAAGWDMGNHSYSHVDLTTLTQAEAQSELEQDIQYLVSNGMPRGARFLGWPYSEFNDATIAAAQDAGILAARTGIAGVTAHDNPPKLLMTRREGTNLLSVATMTGYVDEVIEKGGVLIFNFHDIIDPADDLTDVLPANFQAVIDYLKLKQDQGVLDVVTMSEWYNGLTGRKPLVQARTAPTVQRMTIDSEAVGSLSFDGVDDYVTIPTPALSTTAFTVFFRYKSREISHINEFSFNEGVFNGTGTLWYGKQGSNDVQAYAYLNAPNDYAGPRRLRFRGFRGRTNDGKWHSRALVFYVADGSAKCDEYEDGLKIGNTHTVDYTGDSNTPATTMLVGKAETAINGNMKDVRFINSALTPTEIQSLHYNNIVPSGAVLDLRFDRDTGATAFDSSGKGNHGTITGAVHSMDTPTKARKLIGGNLVENGDFERYSLASPQVALTTNIKYIDGTAVGSGTNEFGWGTGPGSQAGNWSALFDEDIKHSGLASMKVSALSAGTSLSIGRCIVSSASGILNGIYPCIVGKTYNFSVWMKTNYVSGDSNDGAFVIFKTRNASGSTVTSVNTNKIKITSDWTQYTGQIIPGANSKCFDIQLSITGTSGAGTLIMDAWFDDITLTEV